MNIIKLIKRLFVQKNIVLLFLLSFLLLSISGLDLYSPHIESTLDQQSPPFKDNAFHEHAGWYIYNGARPYVDIWQIKFPFVTFELTNLIAIISFGNLFLIHFISIVIMSLIFIGTVILTYILSYRLTSNSSSGFITGLSLLVLPYFYQFSLVGIRPKSIMMFLGLLSLLFMLKGRFFWSGIFSGMAAGSWQIGVIFPLLIVAEIIIFQDYKQKYFFGSGLVLSVIGILLPIIYWGAFESFVTETMIVPFLVTDEKLSFLRKITVLLRELPIITGIILTGTISTCYKFTSDANNYWWLTAGTLFFLLQLSLDFDGPADLIPLFCFASIGVGVGLNNLPQRVFKYINIILVTLIFVFLSYSISWTRVEASIREFSLHYGPTQKQIERFRDYQNGREHLKKLEYSDYFWFKMTFDDCHYRLYNAPVQRKWYELIDKPFQQKTCGNFSNLNSLLPHSES